VVIELNVIVKQLLFFIKIKIKSEISQKLLYQLKIMEIKIAQETMKKIIIFSRESYRGILNDLTHKTDIPRKSKEGLTHSPLK
jgi:hypothetical protein